MTDRKEEISQGSQGGHGSQAGSTAERTHFYLAFSGLHPDREGERLLALQLANYYAKRADWSQNQWRKEGDFVCQWRSKDKDPARPGHTKVAELVSAPFHLNTFRKHLRETRTFDHRLWGLPEPKCRWLDDTISVEMGFHAADPGSKQGVSIRLKPALGGRFPIAPSIDREGAMYLSFQALLIERIASLREWLVENSNAMLGNEWFQNFRTLVSEVVSLVDNTLHQIYFKAQYDPMPGWSFDVGRLGQRHGRRLMDKLSWVYGITGRHIGARDEQAALGVIKDLRNHLQHFDPPSFAFTYEEVADWLNLCRKAAWLVWYIRCCASALPSTKLISLLLQQRVEFVPSNPQRRRVPRPSHMGYASTSATMLATGVLPPQGEAGILLEHTREETLI